MARKSAGAGRDWKGPGFTEAWTKAAELNEEARPEGANWEWAPRNAVVVRRELTPRAALDRQVVAQYREIWDILPPIEVQKGTWVLIDGHHRFEAAGDRDYVKIVERDVSDRDLADVAFLANIQHGLPLKRKERIEAARQYFLRHLSMSNNAIADLVGVARNTVIAWRKAVEDEVKSRTRKPKPAAEGVEVVTNEDGTQTWSDGVTVPDEFADVASPASEGEEGEEENEAPESTPRVDRHGREFTPKAGGAHPVPSAPDTAIVVDWTDEDYVNGPGWQVVQSAMATLSNREPVDYIPLLDEQKRRIFRARLDDLGEWVRSAEEVFSA